MDDLVVGGGNGEEQDERGEGDEDPHTFDQLVPSQWRISVSPAAVVS